MPENESLNSAGVMSRLVQVVDSAKWTEQSPDFLKHYIGSKGNSKRMSVHEPALGVEDYSVTAWFSPDPESTHQIPRWSASMKLRPNFRKLIKELPDWQREHRSRKISLSFARGQAIELQRRAANVQANMTTLKDLQIPDEESLAIAAIQAESFLKHSKVDPEWINHYIREHKNSSVMSGTKWPELGDAYDQRSQWQKLLDIHRSRCESVINGDFMGKMPDFPLSMGSRQRYAGEGVESDVEDWVHSGYIERSRVVLFHPALSSWFAFLPKEKKPLYYKETVMGALDLLEVETTGEYLSPLWDGGKIYERVADSLQGGAPITIGLGDDYNVIDEDGQLHAIDGSTWDSFAGMINGRGSHWMTTRFGGHNSVPSGLMKTSTDDQIAMARTIDVNQRRTGKMVPQMTDSDLIAGVVDFQPADENAKFVLGLTYNLDDGPDYPGICGIKLMTDDADSFRPLQEGRTLNLRRQPDQGAEDAHQAAFLGRTVDNESLLTLLAGMEATEWMSPSVMLKRELYPDVTN